MDDQTPNSAPPPPQPGLVEPGDDAPRSPAPTTEPTNVPAETPQPDPAPVAPPTEPSAPRSVAMDTDDGPVFSWQASEYLHHEKAAVWYLGFAGVIGLLVAIAVITQQWFSIGVFIAMAGALMVYAHKPPRTLSYRLDGSGISIDSKQYSYDRFRSYAIIQDVAWHAVDLEPTQRFMPRLTIMFDDADLPEIETLLSAQLPKVERKPDWIERLSRYLKF